MNNKMFAVVFLALPLCVNAEVKDAIVTIDDIREICDIKNQSFNYDQGGFPFVVDTYKVEIKDDGCGIRADFKIYDYISEGLAKEKLIDLVEAVRSMGIDMKQKDQYGNSYFWEYEDRKSVFISVKEKFVFKAAINVNPRLFESVMKLLNEKYGNL